MPWISKKELECREGYSYDLASSIKPFLKELSENTDKEDKERRTILSHCGVMAEVIMSQHKENPLKKKNIAQAILAIEWAVLIILQIVALIVGWR